MRGKGFGRRRRGIESLRGELVDDDLLAQRLGHLGLNGARDEVEVSSRREGDVNLIGRWDRGRRPARRRPSCAPARCSPVPSSWRASASPGCLLPPAGGASGVSRRSLGWLTLRETTRPAACGNAPLVEVIEHLAMKAHAIRSHSIGNPTMLEAVCREHAEMIELLKGNKRGNKRERLVALVGQHIRPAKEAYLQLARHTDHAPVQPDRGLSSRDSVYRLQPGVVFPRLQSHREAPQPAQMDDHFRGGVVERPAAVLGVAQRQRAVAVAVELTIWMSGSAGRGCTAGPAACARGGSPRSLWMLST